MMAPPARYYEPTDLAMLEQLALNAGLAVDNARLYKYEQSARTTIERAANRMERLQTITTDLAATLTPDDVAKGVIDHYVSGVGASAGAIWVLDEPAGAMRLTRWQSKDEPRPDCIVIPVDGSAPPADALRSRAPVFVESPDDYLRRYPEHAAHQSYLTSFVCLPLAVRRKTIGVIMFAFTGEHVFDADERAFLVLVGDHCGLGFYRASLYEAEQRARSETALLYGFVDAVNRATNLSEVYDASHEVVHEALGVTRSSILLFDDDGVIRFKSARGLSDAYRAAVEGHTPWSRETRDAAPVLVADSETDESCASYRDLFRSEGIRSLGFFPLTSHGKLLGKFMVYSAEPRSFTSDEISLARTIAAQIAQAVARKLSEAEIEMARAAAEHASRMKDEFLAIVSHELRTPLASIMGWASLLQSERRTDPEFMARGLEVIERSAKAQATIIEDILDVSRIIRGKLRLEAYPVSLVPLLVETIDALKTSATAKQIHVELDAEDDEFCIVGDPERLRQVAWNLVSNAIKFTEPRGSVKVRLRRDLGGIVLEVTDTGIGIAKEALPYVFDRFRQVDSTTTRRHGGLGLGLAIVRHIVELHGGQVAVRSGGPGKGSTFSARFATRAIAYETAPAQPTDQPRAATTTAKSSAPVGLTDLAGVRVLVVDDQPDAREMLKEALASYGAFVEVAGSVAAAMEVLQTFRPMVLVTDIGMPDDDGYELLRRVRALPGEQSQIPAVAVTAYARDEDAQRSRAAGFHAHVAKPTRPETLARAVASSLPTTPLMH
jgi:signal transduction histidine kinase/ActR/RegA family two-component response regulator